MASGYTERIVAFQLKAYTEAKTAEERGSREADLDLRHWDQQSSSLVVPDRHCHERCLLLILPRCFVGKSRNLWFALLRRD
jgi:7,8-dihydro-6-hydroxymethylpterin-pyrophosphokinase